MSETSRERRRRIGLESAIKRRLRARYRIQINLAGPHDGKIFPACSLPFVCRSAAEAWEYMEKVNPMKFLVVPTMYDKAEAWDTILLVRDEVKL